jgi:hypothetical protein
LEEELSLLLLRKLLLLLEGLTEPPPDVLLSPPPVIDGNGDSPWLRPVALPLVDDALEPLCPGVMEGRLPVVLLFVVVSIEVLEEFLISVGFCDFDLDFLSFLSFLGLISSFNFEVLPSLVPGPGLALIFVLELEPRFLRFKFCSVFTKSANQLWRNASLAEMRSSGSYANKFVIKSTASCGAEKNKRKQEETRRQRKKSATEREWI